MSRPRILILEDGVAWRRAIVRALEGDEEYEVVGSAELGEIGLAKYKQIHPDGLILGVSTKTAESRGLRLLDEVRAIAPKLPVGVVSPLAERGSPMVLEFLSRGASAFASLSGFTPDADAKRIGEGLRRDLLRKLKWPADVAPARTFVESDTAIQRRSRGFEAVVVGVSTGGPDALEQVLSVVPREFRVPILIVQHILPSFTQSLAARLDSICALSVKEAAGGETPVPGQVWIAPDERHLEVVRSADRPSLRLTHAPKENQCRPAADVLFRSAAKVYGGNLLAVVLTGMGEDGLRGCREIRKAGGTVVVQDEATSVVWGMPARVAEEGLAHEVLPIGKIGAELVRLVGGGTSEYRVVR